jgi:hypothetical protein
MSRESHFEEERRSTPRFNLQLPVILEWQDSLGAHVVGGFTRDVSISGARVLCAEVPSLNSSVEVQVLLPTGDTSRSAVRLEALGKVVRVLGDEGRGIAITAGLKIDGDTTAESYSQHTP